VLAAGSLLMLAFGESPLRVWGEMFGRVLSDPSKIGDTLNRATGLVFTGLAVALALDAGLFNIGVEGQLLAGTLACAVVGHSLPAGTPTALAVPAALAGAMAAGAAVGYATGLLRVRRDAHEVISGIMINEIIAGTALWIGNAALFTGGTARGAVIVPGAELPSLGLGGSAASVAAILALVVAGAAWIVRARTPWGARWRAVGDSPAAAENLGIPVRRVRVWIMAASGALAALAASGLVLGHRHAFEEGLGRGYGYLGVAVGLLGRRHPGGIVLASLALAFLAQGGLAAQSIVPKELSELLIGLAVLAIAVAAPLVARTSARTSARTTARRRA
jgi:general nucleoside transport system permease protein